MKLFFKLPIFVFVVLAVAMQACIDDDPQNPNQQLEADIATIDAYLSANNIDAIKDLSGVRINITQTGTGLVPYYQSTVTVAYVGTVLGRTTPFESSTTTGKISGYILGWQYALTSLPVGSKATVYIPSSLAYGNVAKDGIPANSILVFEVFLQSMTMSTPEVNQFKADTTAIENYLVNKNIVNFVQDPTGIRYVKTLEAPETAPMPALYTPVKFKLALKLLSDDSKELIAVTREPSDSFNGRVVDNIRGLTALLQKMREGEKATVYIPSYLGFASDVVTDNSGAVLVPANTPVIMEIELLDVI